MSLDTTPLLDARIYKSGNKSVLYYSTQVTIHFLTLYILSNVWSNSYILFLWHPTLAVIGFYLFSQGIISVQATESTQERILGLKYHTLFNGLGSLSFFGSFLIIFINKYNNGANHFVSWHGKLGLTIILLILGTAFAGATSVYYPSLYGGRIQAKLIYRPHRIFGYLILALISLNFILGTYSNWGYRGLSNQWLIVVFIIIFAVSILARLDIRKLR